MRKEIPIRKKSKRKYNRAGVKRARSSEGWRECEVRQERKGAGRQIYQCLEGKDGGFF